MARAEVASASVNSDSIKGLAQSIAKPAYRRLLTAEPALRRAVPALIIAFLLTICVGAIVQVLDHRRQAIGDIVKEIEASADFLVDRLQERIPQIESRLAVAGIEKVADDPGGQAAGRGQRGHGAPHVLADPAGRFGRAGRAVGPGRGAASNFSNRCCKPRLDSSRRKSSVVLPVGTG